MVNELNIVRRNKGFFQQHVGVTDSDRIFPKAVKKSPDHIWVAHAKDGWRRR
jgi:hypothetical protein